MSKKSSGPNDNYKGKLKGAVLDEGTFLRLTLSKKLGEDSTPWVKISLRPVLVKGERKTQFSYFDPKKNITKNFSDDDLKEPLDEALALPFSRIHLQSTSGDTHVRITRKGKVLTTKGKPSLGEQEPTLSHDHAKIRPLAADTPDTFLQAIGIMNGEGKVRSSKQGKYRQINEFLKIIEQTVVKNDLVQEPIHIVDCGCGNAYLTFAAYHYLNNVCNLSTHLLGVDINEEIIEKVSRLRDSLGWHEVEFKVSSIAGFKPELEPEIVLSLHACDTATDEAIAQGILWGSRIILAAPCCQHELHHRLKEPSFRPLLRHGILRERLADLTTDAFRALALAIMGYRTNVFEFVSPEHTSKNVMIQAEKGTKPGNDTYIQEYKALKEFWKVSPIIEELLGGEIKRFL